MHLIAVMPCGRSPPVGLGCPVEHLSLGWRVGLTIYQRSLCGDGESISRLEGSIWWRWLNVALAQGWHEMKSPFPSHQFQCWAWAFIFLRRARGTGDGGQCASLGEPEGKAGEINTPSAKAKGC